MPVIAVVGGQWGDEGKGKVIDLLAGAAQVVVRAHGGDNAGHTVVNDQGEFALHLVPAGIFNPSAVCVIGPGVALNPEILVAELDALEARGVSTSGLLISDRAHMVMPYHLALDRAQEAQRGTEAIGTTGRGIGPAYGDKAERAGFRVGDLLHAEDFRRSLDRATAQKNRLLGLLGHEEHLSSGAIADRYLAFVDRLGPYIRDVGPVVAAAVARDDAILLEGAHGTLLDLDHGTYPYATSSACTVAGLCQGAGIAPRAITQAVGVYKAYSTRVGAGPMPTELNDATGDYIREHAREFGTTTGRARRCGWFDAVAARYTAQINGFDSIALTRLDILDEMPVINICVAYEVDGVRVDDFPSSAHMLEQCRPVYEQLPGWQTSICDAADVEDLPGPALAFIQRVEELVGAPAEVVGVGPARSQTVSRRNLWPTRA